MKAASARWRPDAASVAASPAIRSRALTILPVTTDDMRAIFAADDSPHVEIGTVYPTDDIRGTLYVDPMLSKHFAILGSTGTGKSTSVALILHRISQLSPEGHIVMIDPHGEYSAAFKSCGELFNVDNLQLPYWLMNFEEHCEVLLTTDGAERQRDADILAKCLLAARTKSKIAEQFGKVTVDSPIPYLLTDLNQILVAEMGKLDRAGDTTPYQRLKNKLDELRADPRYTFMFSGMLVSDTMGELHRQAVPPAEPWPADLDRRRVGRSVRSHVGRGFGAGAHGVRLCDLVADRGAAPAAAGLRRGPPLRPQGRELRAARRFARSSSASPRKAVNTASRWASSRSARPTLAEGVLSQCGTIISMRLNNDRDQACVRAAMPEGARGFLDAIPALRNRECIVCGEGVAIPIRVRFDDLEPEKRPASSDPSFAAAWRETGDEEGIIQRTVQRWRGHGK